MSYKPKFLSWCKNHDQEVAEIKEMLNGDSADFELLKIEYEILTGRDWNEENLMKFKIGDRVKSGDREGVVDRIDEGCDYPIRVTFDDTSEESYDKDGRILENSINDNLDIWVIKSHTSFEESIYELAFGDNAHCKGYTEEQVIERIKEFAENSWKYEEL